MVIKDRIDLHRPNSPTSLNELLGGGTMNKKYQLVVKSWQSRKTSPTSEQSTSSRIQNSNEKLMFMKDFKEFENTEITSSQSKFSNQINLLEE